MLRLIQNSALLGGKKKKEHWTWKKKKKTDFQFKPYVIWTTIRGLNILMLKVKTAIPNSAYYIKDQMN